MTSRTPTSCALLQTPFHGRTSEAAEAQVWGRWDGYATVGVYSAVELEYFAIRNTATIFDLSPMKKYRVTGPDAERFLNRLVTRDITKLVPGRVAYCLWCNDDGQVLDDGTLFRFAEEDFRLCCQERQLVWLSDSAYGFEVHVEDVSEAIAALSLQGPTSCAVLKRLGLRGIETLKPFAWREAEADGLKFTVSRTGFTGDLGYELWMAPEDAETLWDALMLAGAYCGIRPVGSAALDLARIEAGFVATNADFLAADQAVRRNRGRTPFELGLGRLVDFDKGHFTGRRALQAERREDSARYCLVGLDIEGNKPAKIALVYHRKSREVGHITSAMWSPTCKRNLALAMLRRPYGQERQDDLWVQIYTNKELKWDHQMCRARIVERPFFKPARRSATPALDY